MDHGVLELIDAVVRGSGRLQGLLLLLRPLLVLLPILRPPVLEPNLDLALGEAKGSRQLCFAPDGDVAVGEGELLFQLDPLVVGVDDAVLVFRAGFAWKKEYVRLKMARGGVF